MTLNVTVTRFVRIKLVVNFFIHTFIVFFFFYYHFLVGGKGGVRGRGNKP